MADNVGYTPGSGAVVAADEVGGVLYQRIKPVIGDDGTVVDVSDANPMPTKDSESRGLLLRILQMLMAPLGYDKSLQRQRGTVVVESGTVTTVTTVTTLTTCAAVTSLNNLDGYNARMQILDNNRTAWAQCVRSRIT
jgi:NADPH:quinone reductase-like Zn-dependent oxidoreductase